jgi:hypothetical protein
VAGLIASVSGNTIQVNQRNGTATVVVTPSTVIAEQTPAGLTDVTPGSCVTVRPTPDSAPPTSGTVTAQAVLIAPANNGQCSQPQGGQGRGVRGTMASVNGNTITLNTGGNPAQINVSVTNTTTYIKRAASNAQAITQGKCISARGTKDSSGALQATAISLQPATNGNCPGPRR